MIFRAFFIPSAYAEAQIGDSYWELPESMGKAFATSPDRWFA
jgi:hypothetical protein